ncbi:MAG TPA: DCC1-like thiol-disulfide oxidoreductase family protein [Xanthobacteraceae bacterium]|jgi:predicted DCC family thiol-disulfide oxidoreductase YuxK
MRGPYSYRDDPAVPRFADDRPVIIFDGECVLCSGSAQFVIRHDGRKVYRLLAAQTPLGRALYAHFDLDARDYETMIVLADGVALLKSEAVIRIAEGLGLPWSVAAVFRVVPRSWRDRLYGVLARNRLRLLGRREHCYVPAPGDADRFLA